MRALLASKNNKDHPKGQPSIGAHADAATGTAAGAEGAGFLSSPLAEPNKFLARGLQQIINKNHPAQLVPAASTAGGA